MKRLILLQLILIGCFLPLLGACSRESRPVVAEVGRPAPDFTLVDTKGRSWTLSKLRGKVVFVNFWATWCPPCRKEMPSMQALDDRLPDEHFVMLSIVSNDDPALADALAAELGTSFPILVDPQNAAGLAFGLTGVPETYIIDKQGILRRKFLGAVQWDSDAVVRMIEEYIKKPGSGQPPESQQGERQ